MKKFRLSIYDTEHILLRDWLISKRQALNLTQRQLAEKLQVVHSLIGKVEKGERRLDVIEFMTYCQALNTEPCEFYNLMSSISSSS
ncbi:MAG: transcriptional regulator [Gammaproteobacteria bacterium]|nr:MAG: transcriptional regulator [Gammaproteobacteria bacterium]